ncbi:MAG TPA: PIN domain-containing protein [Abditibacteriaceae bacterium]|jgi:predicted nucleic acid-binding protein
MKSVTLFLDTNVFINFQSIHQIDWLKLADAATVQIIILPVNIRELNKLKDSPEYAQKTRTRAASAISQLRQLSKSPSPHVLRSAVEVHFEHREPNQKIFTENNLSSIPDDFYIASAIQFRIEQPSASLIFVTNDFGIEIKAPRYGIDTRTPPEENKLPYELDEDQKRIKKLEQELLALKSRSPELQLAFLGKSATSKHILRLIPVLSNTQIENRLELAKKKFPRRSSKAFNSSDNDDSLFALTVLSPKIHQLMSAYESIPNSELERYNTELEEFYLSYRNYLIEKFKYEDKVARTIKLQLEINNIGTSPATDIDVHVSLAGEFMIWDTNVVPPPPQEPEPPKEPETLSERMHYVPSSRLSSMLFNNVRSTDKESVPVKNVSIVNISLERVMHFYKLRVWHSKHTPVM